MAQSQVLEFEGSARAEDSTQSSEECREKNEHRRRVYESSINGSRSDISRFSRATASEKPGTGLEYIGGFSRYLVPSPTRLPARTKGACHAPIHLRCTVVHSLL